ncbi:Yippee/Mis18 [Dipodascopsis tothii]|uniref:Yippee/Mis18 n=1 Tax=Dipodascopsis tothii TaxID=44089 RepID=UPI0034CE466B
MGLSYNVYLTDSRIYGCKSCNTHLSNYTDIISRQFQGHHGKAFLFHKVVNVTESKPENRAMTTGDHTVRDIICRQCGTCVGWKYDYAVDPTQKYKEGKFILEMELLTYVK